MCVRMSQYVCTNISAAFINVYVGVHNFQLVHMSVNYVYIYIHMHVQCLVHFSTKKKILSFHFNALKLQAIAFIPYLGCLSHALGPQ